jgi:hypothetical protein
MLQLPSSPHLLSCLQYQALGLKAKLSNNLGYMLQLPSVSSVRPKAKLSIHSSQSSSEQLQINEMITWKPDLMLATEQRDPHVSHCKKKRRVSFCRMVSGERHVWHVTYSLMYRLKTFSICFCWNLPLIMSWLFPSTEPLVPNSASRKSSKCFDCRCNLEAKRTTLKLTLENSVKELLPPILLSKTLKKIRTALCHLFTIWTRQPLLKTNCRKFQETINFHENDYSSWEITAGTDTNTLLLRNRMHSPIINM